MSRKTRCRVTGREETFDCTHLCVTLVKVMVVRVCENEFLVTELGALEPRILEVERCEFGPPLSIRGKLVEVLRQLLDCSRQILRESVCVCV